MLSFPRRLECVVNRSFLPGSNLSGSDIFFPVFVSPVPLSSATAQNPVAVMVNVTVAISDTVNVPVIVAATVTVAVADTVNATITVCRCRCRYR